MKMKQSQYKWKKKIQLISSNTNNHNKIKIQNLSTLKDLTIQMKDHKIAIQPYFRIKSQNQRLIWSHLISRLVLTTKAMMKIKMTRGAGRW